MHPGTRYLKDLVFETEITKWYSSDFLLLFYKIITLFINVNTAIIKIIKIDYFYDIEFFSANIQQKQRKCKKKQKNHNYRHQKALQWCGLTPFFKRLSPHSKSITRITRCLLNRDDIDRRFETFFLTIGMLIKSLRS